VRKASYFARNTRLLGDGFEFTANPWAILRGRVLALGLLGFYTFAYDFSLTLGLVATAVLLAAAPLLFASATRFRLRNTRWRALRFDFTASKAAASAGVSSGVSSRTTLPPAGIGSSMDATVITGWDALSADAGGFRYLSAGASGTSYPPAQR